MRRDYKTTQLQGISDLTVLARVKDGYVPGAFNIVTYAERLRQVLRVLQNVRQASREASLQPSPFADSIGRFRAIHFFRFAVVPSPDDVPGRHHLLLNVTFDGGWEPYMRLIWGPLGALLDVIFCHCENYPLALDNSYETYVRWVRENEVVANFFYADSGTTVADAHYLRELQQLQRDEGAESDIDRSVTGLAVPALANPIPSAFAVQTALRVLKSLSALKELFPPNKDRDVLLRFSRDLLHDLCDWVASGLFDPGGPFEQLRSSLVHERKWLTERPKQRKDINDNDPPFIEADEQYGAKAFPDGMTHGVLVLLRVTEVDKTKRWFQSDLVEMLGSKGNGDEVYCSMAITFAGLRVLEVPRSTLERLPYEFIEGMEARAGVLGDLRRNHPDNWKRPVPNWPTGEKGLPQTPIEFSTVHIVAQLRTATKQGEQTDHTLHPRLASAIKSKFDAGRAGLEVLFVQPMQSRARETGEPFGRDHFGFVDGVSQPTLRELFPSSRWSDQVMRGDLYYGYANSRGDRASEPPNQLLHQGTFLVVRKLRQFPERLDEAVGRVAEKLAPDRGAQQRTVKEIKEKLIGRRVDGKPLVRVTGSGGLNDFDFRGDPKGLQCPFQSHIRRANPREEMSFPTKLPRIVRRGMSYGPAPTEDPENREERGVVFLAYNASIAEQFEVIQRWLTGGNSSGVSSTQTDPLLGASEPGQSRVFAVVIDGKVVRVDLGHLPIVELEWGLYAFVPSIAVLRKIAEGNWEADVNREPERKPNREPERKPDPDAELDKFRVLFESGSREDTWRKVRNHHFRAPDYGELVGSRNDVVRVLKDDGEKYTVSGYGKRMNATLGGNFYLGMDDKEHRNFDNVNRVIGEQFPEASSFDAALKVATDVLERKTEGGVLASIEIPEFVRDVLARLCKLWFGLPDGQLMKYATLDEDSHDHRESGEGRARADLESAGRGEDDDKDMARCPGDLLMVSRYSFSPNPLKVPVKGLAKTRGPRIVRAFKKLLERDVLTSQVRAIIANLPESELTRDRKAINLAGIMLGFPPPTLGNLVSVLTKWIQSKELWELQLDILNARAESKPFTHDDANLKLRDRLLSTMATAPVPYAVWRRAAKDTEIGGTRVPKDYKVIVGLGSSMAEKIDKDSHHRFEHDRDHMLMFGGSRENGELWAPHACPGYGMAMGVMLGCITALLLAGTLKATSDPRVLTLIKNPDVRPA